MKTGRGAEVDRGVDDAQFELSAAASACDEPQPDAIST
jgi:hypothetical protein